MARSRQARRRAKRNAMNKSEDKAFFNSLSGLADGLRIANELGQATGGSSLSSYGTVGWSTNYGLITLNQVLLSFFYSSNGLFQTAIQLPIQDGLAKGFEIESDEMDAQDIDDLMDYWEDKDLSTVLLNYMTWVRLFGGGGIIVNSAADPAEPLDLKSLQRSEIEFYPVDRWELTVGAAVASQDLSYTLNSPDSEMFYFRGNRVNGSRVITSTGKMAPYRVRSQLSGWGLSEGERMIRDLNLYLKTQDVLYEILDEAKIDVYKIQGLAEKLMQPASTNKIQQRIQIANELKNYLNALVMDSEDDYEQKSMTFSGLAEVMNENRIGVAAALRMPMVKLYGISPSGFSSGETDLDNYNQMVESEIQAKLKKPIRQLLKIGAAHLWGYTPSFRIKWNPLKPMDPEIDERVKASKTSRILMLYDRGLMNSEEVGKEVEKQNLIDTPISAALGLLPPQPAPPAPSADVDSDTAGSGKSELMNSSPTKRQERKIARVMREYEAGKLKSSSGKPVKDKNQALAIAYAEAGVK